MLPATVRRIGTLVVMDEIFYYSRKVGMSLSLFVHTFPIVKHVTEVKLILGPGHYEEPSWPADGAHSFVAALNEKLPKLECVRMKAHLGDPAFRAAVYVPRRVTLPVGTDV
ncbi:hypothetical protein AK812_SmicGene38711 [Symbiodinium microadriaticum]|uniref:Uncharacterized protein n=1 Tax=Symbiodinium microadriaticum TaxID=2951 RepID=A0A1Q9CD33_SYMMI|nr:hypothetical protein AK812_SmicGene38711 [Symbiodinium microadriaticum]